MYYLRQLIFAGLLSGLLPTSLLASENWGLCRIPAFHQVETQSDQPANTEVVADQVLRDENNFLNFSGEVRLTRGSETIDADQIIYDEDNEQLEARGSVIFEKPEFRLSSEYLSLDQKNYSAEIDAAEFEMRGRHGRGSASKIEILDASRSRFSEIMYTACDPGDRDWHFTSDDLQIDDERGLGIARHATIYFQEIPFFYLPYFQFPIDDRRMSGVLTPTFNISDSDNSHMALPIYWNIAPNFDTTFKPAWYSERGLQYASEHRYLFQHNRGQVDLTYLDDDITGDTRWFKRWEHQSYPDIKLSGDLLLQEVSDADYFGDFDRLVPGTNEIKHLDRHLELVHAGDYWQTSLFWQNYQTVDTSIGIAGRPYQRLPRLTFDSKFQPWENGLEFNMENELVRFKRESSINGSRGHLLPSLGWTSSESWYFFEPQLQYDFTEYALDNNTLGENAIQRGLPIASLDTGLFFERFGGSEGDWLQTLEPRLYFVHIPFEDQSDIPDFDTALLPETYNNFFRANRFSGADRVGDTDQVSFGLGSRIYNNESGRALLYARVAQIFYADDRLVSLNGDIDNRKRSNIITEIDINPTPDLKIGTDLVYDEILDEFSKRELSVNWAKNGYAANFEYFFKDSDLEQSLVSVVYPVNERWTLIAKYHKSLLFDKPVENLFGISYESCCWGLKILASQVSDDDFIETDRALFFELTLKGLTQAGKDVDAHLRQAIPGYQSRF